MLSRDEILDILRKAKASLQSRFKVHSIALFGSYARNEQNEQSDVDILVDVDPSIGLEFVSLAEHIENLIGHHVDLISRRAVKKRHWAIIQQELLYV